MTWLAVAIGGAGGALARYALGLALPVTAGQIPWATLVVNVVGSLILAVLAALTLAGRLENDTVRLLVGTGFCGALTTFSTFAVEAVTLARSGHTGTAVAFVGLNLLLGFAAVALILWLIPGVPSGDGAGLEVP